MSSSETYLKGLALTGLGVVIISPDALLIRLIDASPWTILIWRGFGFTGVQLLLAWWRLGRRLPRVLLATGRAGILVALVFGTCQILFVLAISLTTAANALVIIAASPLAAAVIARLAYAEPIRARTAAAGLVALACVALTAASGLRGGGGAGIAAALGVTVVLAAFFNLLRQNRARDLSPALALGGLLPGVVGLLLAPALLPPPAGVAPLLALCLFVSPISFALISIGPRYLPAPDTSLLMLVETVLGPFLVWLVLAETPGPLALVGGGVLLLTLFVHALIGLREAREHDRLAAAGLGAL